MDAMRVAAMNGHLDVVKWLHEMRTEGCSVDAMDAGALYGHADVVQSIQGMYNIRNGRHLNVVQWLHNNTSAGCTTEAMDKAATNGHFKVVEWLHEHRSEGCTTTAMDGAAQNGHLNIVKYLHDKRSKGCTVAAMDQASEEGYLHVVQWLQANRSEGCTSAAIDTAAEYGHFETLLFLHSQCQQKCTAKTLMTSIDNLVPALQQWIRHHYPHLRLQTTSKNDDGKVHVCSTLLFRSKTNFIDLPHVVNIVSHILDSSTKLPLHKAEVYVECNTNISVGITHKVMTEVAHHGQMDMLQFFDNNVEYWLREQVRLDGAIGLVVKVAETGPLEVLRWLFEHMWNSNAERVIDMELEVAVHTAAINGHLDVAKYLHGLANAK
ncbi:hypothetical protein PHMEG_00026612 [Phytophthora megakarya]|uniref:Uncharacterized protein n=1 Tax=Phytophthora megakarya TaxID=4795 RepID=A0A225VBR2_9STRA|nr:hypothetical protein PHMEG_00026612 [Phytophthora megakarya]